MICNPNLRLQNPCNFGLSHGRSCGQALGQSAENPVVYRNRNRYRNPYIYYYVFTIVKTFGQSEFDRLFCPLVLKAIPAPLDNHIERMEVSTHGRV